jgi:hypothetical protein
VCHYLTHCNILTLLASLHDLLLLMTYKFVCMPPLWRTPTHCDHLQCFVTAIHINPHLLPHPNRFMSLLWASRCENPKYVVKEFTRKLVEVVKAVLKEDFPMELLVKEYTPMMKTDVYHRTLFNLLHFLMATRFLVGLCPACLQLQVTKMLIAARQHRLNET